MTMDYSILLLLADLLFYLPFPYFVVGKCFTDGTLLGRYLIGYALTVYVTSGSFAKVFVPDCKHIYSFLKIYERNVTYIILLLCYHDLFRLFLFIQFPLFNLLYFISRLTVTSWPPLFNYLRFLRKFTTSTGIVFDLSTT